MDGGRELVSHSSKQLEFFCKEAIEIQFMFLTFTSEYL